MVVLPLTPAQVRVLAVLVEKQATVPDTYPLSLNALVAGCNQKTARDPVMNFSDADALAALDELKQRSLIVEVSGSRVLRYEHNTARVLGVPGAAVALLAVLALRGPQTVAELRANCERLHRFADVSSVEAFLDELAAKPAPLVLHLARAPGEREARWAHLLCGETSLPAAAPASQSAGPDRMEELAAQLQVLRAEQARLAELVEQLREQLSRFGRGA